MNEIELKTDENDIQYYESLPNGYIVIPQFKELFKTNNDSGLLTLDNAVLRTGLELIIYNPFTKQYYPRVLSTQIEKEQYWGYFKDKNLFIQEKDLIWKKKD